MNISNEIKAGMFIVISLVLLTMSVFIMGRERQIFSSQEEYHTAFKDIKGLSPGAPVRLGGITIGRVEQVSFAEKLNDPSVHVGLLINEDYLERLRTDSVVTIETQGLLGDRFINISTGKNQQLLPPGSYLTSEDSGDMAQILSKAQKVVDNTVEIADNLNNVLKDFRGDSGGNLKAAATDLYDILREIREGNGLLHRLVYSKKDGDDLMKSMKSTADSLADITSEVKGGDGVLHALIYEPGGKELVNSLTAASSKLALLSSDVSGLAIQIKEGNGMLHDMIYGEAPEGVDDVIKKLNATAENLKTASEALSQGSGTLGALLVDSQLYDNLVEVTDGAKRSFLLREAIQSSLGQ